MKAKPLPSYEVLSTLFTYDSITGIVTRKPHNNVPVGYSQGLSRHLCVCIDYKSYYLHRIIWCLMTKTDPGEMIVDHMDGNTHNNAWCNLRTVVKAINNKNQTKRKHKYGYPGVSKLGNMYRAYTKIEGIYRHLGMFATPEEAVQRVKEADIKTAIKTNDSVLLAKASK